jgi:hypothetical protein
VCVRAFVCMYVCLYVQILRCVRGVSLHLCVCVLCVCVHACVLACVRDCVFSHAKRRRLRCSLDAHVMQSN